MKKLMLLRILKIEGTRVLLKPWVWEDWNTNIGVPLNNFSKDLRANLRQRQWFYATARTRGKRVYLKGFKKAKAPPKVGIT